MKHFWGGIAVPGVLFEVVSVAIVGCRKMMSRWIEDMYSSKMELPLSTQRYPVQPGFCVDFLKQKLNPAFVSSDF